MDGKAFAWQRHYMQNIKNTGKSWQQIIKDTGNRFDSGTMDDPVADLARLKQEGTLLDYLERFDTLLAPVDIFEDLAFSFFLSGLTVELKKSVRVHAPKTFHEAIRLARLQDEVVQVMAQKFSTVNTCTTEYVDKTVEVGSAPVSSTKNYPITTLNPSSGTHSAPKSDSTCSSVQSLNRKQASERLPKVCRFFEEKWDKDHKRTCKVWGKLNAIFGAQDQILVNPSRDTEDEQNVELIVNSLEIVREADSCNTLQGIT